MKGNEKQHEDMEEHNEKRKNYRTGKGCKTEKNRSNHCLLLEWSITLSNGRRIASALNGEFRHFFT